jgi:hypothetical protein
MIVSLAQEMREQIATLEHQGCELDRTDDGNGRVSRPDRAGHVLMRLSERNTMEVSSALTDGWEEVDPAAIASTVGRELDRLPPKWA